MDADQVREYLLRLPDVVETMQWGANLFFWVGDKAIGAKMFALVNLDDDGKVVLSFAAGAERFGEFLEREGTIPAPYLARAHWIGLEHWSVLPRKELEESLAAARDLIYAKLPRRTRDVLAMPLAERRRLIAQRKKLLTKRAPAQTKSKPRSRRGKATPPSPKR